MSRGVAAKAVSDGRRIRWTLEQVAQAATDRVRIDWLRFTLPLAAIVPYEERAEVDATALGALDRRGRELQFAARASQGTDEPLGAMYVAKKAAAMLCGVLDELSAGGVEERGMDFYIARVPLLVQGETVGFVLAGGKSSDQAATVHVNLFGSACLHVSPGKWCRVKQWIDQAAGWVTRCDLAVDVFAGDDVAELPAQYLAGRFDVRGQRPSQREAGAWTSGHSRSFYVGRRETGKEFRGYEKGDQLLGHEAGDEWVRYEVEFRNNARVIDTDILTRCADFFAGAYPFCEGLLDRLEVQAQAQRIPAGQRLKDKTAEAAVRRVAGWVRRVAAPSLCAVLSYGGELIDGIVESESWRQAARLRGWGPGELRRAFDTAFGAMAPAPG